MKKISVLFLTLLLIGCKDKQANHGMPSAPPISIDSPIEFTVYQRSTTPLPRSDNKLLLALGDITANQILVTLSWDDGRPIFTNRSLRENDIVAFTISNHTYELELKQLINLFIGEDSAVFQLSPVTAKTKTVLAEQDKIEMLISSLRQLSDAKFIRNNHEYTVEEAITHMKNKWNWKRSEIKTAEDFIEIAGSKSSVSGQAYLIKLADGTVMKSEQWFRKQLDLMNRSPNKSSDEY